MGRQELLGLIEATSDAGNQRVTAQMPVAVPAHGEHDEHEQHVQLDDASAAGFVVRFRAQPHAPVTPQRMIVIAASFVLSLAVGVALAATFM